ncbi:DUF2767 family protein [Pantoea anthophila]|uniref:DUF2767 family protein n=1 Tax=Pantoea anthophila TaxID=470931 RepID=UPI003AFA3FE5
MSKQADELYDEMCRVIGDVVFTLHDYGIESKQIVIADALRRALASKTTQPGLSYWLKQWRLRRECWIDRHKKTGTMPGSIKYLEQISIKMENQSASEGLLSS